MHIFEAVYSKRFLTIYLVLVAVLLLLFVPRESSQHAEQQNLPVLTAALDSPRPLPQILLRTVQNGIFTNADLLEKWSFVYLYDRRCEPDCTAIWQVLNNLAAANSTESLAVLVIETDTELSGLDRLNTSISRLQATPETWAVFEAFFTQHLTTPETAVFLINPQGEWHAQFVAPFTSATLQQHYLQLRARYARSRTD